MKGLIWFKFSIDDNLSLIFTTVAQIPIVQNLLMIFKKNCNPIYFGKVFLFSIITPVVSQLHIKVDANTIWCWRKITVAITTLLIFLNRFCVFNFLSIHLFSNGFRGYSSSVKNAIIKDLIEIQIHFGWQPILDVF